VAVTVSINNICKSITSSKMEALLGPKLQGKDGEIDTAAALAGKTGVALYFSAHWCPPCRGFTPQFAKQYTDTYKEKGMEVVFVSSDRDQAAFDEYYGEMPWLALPFSERGLKDKLSKKFKVGGIPSLVMLQPDGTFITDKARGKLDQPDSYPWIPPTFAEVMADAKIVDKDGTKDSSTLSDKALGIYFSAHWCPPCRGFTPKLKEMYDNGLKDKMEILFVSSDKDQAAFNEYYSEQPWKALSFDQRDKKEALSDMFGVEGIPSFVILDKEGKVVTKDGRSKVTADPKAETFPEGWLPQPINDVNDDPSDLNGETCVLVYGPDDAATAAITAVAKEHHAAAGGNIDDMKYRFFVAPDGDIMTQIRKLTETPSAMNRLAILDLPSGGKYFVELEEAPITVDSIKKMIADFEGGSIAMKQIAR